MVFKKIVSLLTLLMLFTTCKKHKYPDSVVINEPVYYSDLDVNGRGTKISAGQKGYYQYSSYAQDSDFVYILNSALANQNCKDCGESIEFNFHDLKKTSGTAAISIDSVLKIGNKEFVREGRTPSYVVEFRGNYNLPTLADNLVWNFGDGSSDKGYVVSHTFKMKGNYNVCLTGKGSNACLSSNCNVLNLGSDAPQVAVSHTNFADSAVFKAAVSGGKAPYTYQWNFGDGSRSTLAAPFHRYLITGSYPVVLTVKDSNGKTGICNYNLVTGKDNSSCAANYSVSAITIGQSGSQNFLKVELKYRGENGVLYTSAKIDQNENSKFEIVSVTDAGTNENGDKLKKIEVSYSALVSNGIETLQISNGKAIIAVAYK